MAKVIQLKSFALIAMTAFIAMFACTLLLPSSEYIRYQAFKGTIFERLSWIYDRLYFDKSTIDVMFVGSSRTGAAVSVNKIEQNLADRGLNLALENISLPSAGYDLRLTKIALALEAHPEIKMIVFGVNEAMPRDGHQAFGDLGRTNEILHSPLITNRKLPRNLAALPFRQLKLAVSSIVPNAFGYHADFNQALYSGPKFSVNYLEQPEDELKQRAFLQSAEHRTALANESRRRQRQITAPILPSHLSWIEFGVSQTYVKRLASMTAERGISLVFLYLPFYEGYDAPVDADYFTQFGELWNANYLKSDAENFGDAAHLSFVGQRKISPWLADKVLDKWGAINE